MNLNHNWDVMINVKYSQLLIKEKLTLKGNHFDWWGLCILFKIVCAPAPHEG